MIGFSLRKKNQQLILAALWRMDIGKPIQKQVTRLPLSVDPAVPVEDTIPRTWIRVAAVVMKKKVDIFRGRTDSAGIGLGLSTWLVSSAICLGREVLGKD